MLVLTKSHSEFQRLNWPLKPAKAGHLQVAKDRGGPFGIYYEVHGTGPVKMAWIMGLGATFSTWQRQTKDFGHDAEDRYSMLVLDNRGIGKSDKPLLRYTTSEMAEDVYEVLRHLGWTERRSVHVLGLSMGGMIAQELAWAHPELICSLTLMATAARLVNTIGFWENLWRRVLMFMPKSEEQQIAFAASLILSEEWLAAPDEVSGESSSLWSDNGGKDATPSAAAAGAGFPYNRDRFAASELSKRRNRAAYPPRGFLLQAIAANWHHKSRSQLQELARRIGGSQRIQVMHGSADNMITLPHAHTLSADLSISSSSSSSSSSSTSGITSNKINNITTTIWDGVGHGVLLERRADVARLVRDLVVRTEAMPDTLD